MKLKKISVIFILICCVLSIYAQNEFSVVLNWDNKIKTDKINGEEINYLTFSNSVIMHETGTLPVFQKSVLLRSKSIDINATIKDCNYLPIRDSIISRIDYADLIEKEIKINTNVLISRNNITGEVYFVPIRFNANTKKYEKLVSFTLVIDHLTVKSSHSTIRSAQYKDNSILSQGEWYKFRVKKTGIQMISYYDLEKLPVDIDNIDPRTIQLFGNGNGMVPDRNILPRPDDLMENAIYVKGEEDGSFDQGDYILFFAEAGAKWDYQEFKEIFIHQINYYSDYTCYYLTFNQKNGKRISEMQSDTSQPTHIVDEYQGYCLHEIEDKNLIRSGKKWVGEEFHDVLERAFNFDIPNIETNEKISATIAYVIRSEGEHYFEVIVNDEILDTLLLPKINLGGRRFAHTGSRKYNFYSDREEVAIKLKYNPFDSYSYSWLDYIEMQYTGRLVFENSQLFFRNITTIDDGNITRFVLSGTSGDVKIWEVTDRYNITEVQTDFKGSTTEFTLATDSLREFIAWDESEFYNPEYVEEVPNQNLHALEPADLIIVTHPVFQDYAVELADLHHQHDGLSSHVVTTDKIYNEFSSGILDPSGIRDFVRMLYERGKSSDQPRYLLLFGDGSYDPKDRTPDNFNFIPTYQSNESYLMTSSYVTDDFYGLMDSVEGGDATGSPDIGVGRFPVNTQLEAATAVNKVKHYITSKGKVMDEWRNEIVFVADDEDSDLHFIQAEKLVEIVDTSNKQYHPNKIYLDAFTQIKISGSERYPDVNTCINKSVNEGALIYNYTGHGGELGWSEEMVLDINMINNWKNLDNMPLFMTATCEFSRFDNPELVSAGELVFGNPDGGGIALFTTTRIAFSQANFNLNRNFYLKAFEPINGTMPRLGDIIRRTKAKLGDHNKNFTLLGDPALKLAYPHYNIITNSIIAEESKIERDTISALSRIIVKGEVQNNDGTVVSDFNGVLTPMVYDKPVLSKTRGNDHQSSEREFETYSRLLFKGKVSVADGKFEFTFSVPQNIDYDYGIGRIIYYAKDTILEIDANGFKEIVIGGINEDAQDDNYGPDISTYLNSRSFQSGDVVGPNPVLIADIEDDNGINFYGDGIGYDMVAVLDDDHANSIVLNEYFELDMDQYNKGSLRCQLEGLKEGPHTLQLKAWDIYNNSSEASIDFLVSASADVVITNLRNYPNPFAYETTFTFGFIQKNGPIDIKIEIFTMRGKKVKEIHVTDNLSKSLVKPIVWNGNDNRGNKLDGGTYIYNVIITNKDGYKAEDSGKLVIIN